MYMIINCLAGQYFSDHYVVEWAVHIPKPEIKNKTIIYRKLTVMNIDNLCTDIHVERLSSVRTLMNLWHHLIDASHMPLIFTPLLRHGN